MIKYVNGTVFNQQTDAIVNTVNTVGVMGAGLALEFALRYPDMFIDYEDKCKKGIMKVGEVDYFETSDVIIINFPTKWHFKYPSKIEWVESGLQDFVRTYKKSGIRSVAFPRLGTSKGGLDWSDVRPLMEKYLSDLDIPVYICLDKAEPAGLEKRMIDKFNSTNFTASVDGVKLNKNQREVLERSKPIKRFYEVKELEDIGITCYRQLFNYCKEDKSDTNEQISFEF